MVLPWRSNGGGRTGTDTLCSTLRSVAANRPANPAQTFSALLHSALAAANPGQTLPDTLLSGKLVRVETEPGQTLATEPGQTLATEPGQTVAKLILLWQQRAYH